MRGGLLTASLSKSLALVFRARFSAGCRELPGTGSEPKSVGIRVKICGLTNVEDALACVDAGADAIGLNFWVKSSRYCELESARRIVEAVRDRIRIVGVFVDATQAEIERLLHTTGVEWAQLHGSEPPALVSHFLPRAYKAVRPVDEASLEEARSMPGDELLVDASVPGMPGGTGQTCDWSLAARLASQRRIWLAGGLTPDNVALSIERVSPYGVDVASGVERKPGIKDHALVRAFVAAARGD